jgi:thiosulfate/3-mercaptopyruvate sulfurtransferase
MRQRTPFQCIGVGEAKRLVAGGDVLLLDVRNAQSFDRGHVEGACNVSMASISAVISATLKSRPVLIYCYHGNASREYA